MRLAQVSAIVMLAFLGLSAIAGAVPMILHPFGPAASLPLSYLRFSPFHSYLIPGIILLVANGLLTLWVLWRVVRRSPGRWLWIGFQGCVLLVWLVVECWMLRMVIWLHYLYGAVALVLIVSALALRNAGATERSVQGW